MTYILPNQISKVQTTVSGMGLNEKIVLCDEIRKLQPALLASVLAQSKLGTSNEDLDYLIELLLVCYKSATTAGINLREITEADQELCLARIGGRTTFIDGLSTEMANKAYRAQIQDHPETHLLSYVVDKIKSHRVSRVETDADKYFIMSALNVVETITYVSRDA